MYIHVVSTETIGPPTQMYMINWLPNSCVRVLVNNQSNFEEVCTFEGSIFGNSLFAFSVP